MVKPKYLYHGSGGKIKILKPRQARDLNKKNPHNNFNAIYASSVRNEAISMALHSSKGTKGGSLHMHKVNGKIEIKNSIIYNGWPKQKYVYLYTLPSKTFVNKPRGSSQWVSFEAVKPKKIEKLIVKKHIHLVRRPTEIEAKKWALLMRKSK